MMTKKHKMPLTCFVELHKVLLNCSSRHQGLHTLFPTNRDVTYMYMYSLSLQLTLTYTGETVEMLYILSYLLFFRLNS